MNDQPLVLASASPRRRELLATIYPKFIVDPCRLAEPRLKSTKARPEQWAQALAYFKARAVAEHHPDRWVLGADTIVECEGQILGKPADLDDARRMLELQARHVSRVITGVCLVRAGEATRRFGLAETTSVWMRDEREVREAYLRGGDWAGKAGAYGIQNVRDQLVERIEGSFSNVVGLPLEAVGRLLRTLEQPVVTGRDVEAPGQPGSARQGG